MARNSLADDLMDGVKAVCFHLPFWAVPLLALAIGAGSYWAASEILGDLIQSSGSGSNIPLFAGGFGFVLAFVAGVAGWAERRKRKQLLAQTSSLETLRSLSWREFEQMVSEAFRTEGFRVSEGAGRSPDGGIDLDLRSPAGKRVLVQCKHWKKAKIGVSIVREMLGVLTREKADKVIIVVTGSFTKEAVRWAQGQPIELIDGPALLQRFSSMNPGPPPSESKPQSLARNEAFSPSPSSAPASPPAANNECPRCGKALVRRTARRGTNAGNEFWGCSGYPDCRFTKPIGSTFT